jgi:hypothetical protein
VPTESGTNLSGGVGRLAKAVPVATDTFTIAAGYFDTALALSF